MACVSDGSPVPGGNAVFIFAHNDDEIFINARIRRLIASGRGVEALWLTSGLLAPSPEVRRQESRWAMARLGVPERALTFWDYPDLRTLGYLEELVIGVASYLQGRVVAELYVPAYEGGHPDHDVANFAVSQAAARIRLVAPIYEFPINSGPRGRRQLIGGFFADSLPAIRTPPRPDDRQVWADLWRCHRTQYRYLRLPMAFCLDRRRWSLGEPYRPLPRHDYLNPPHRGRLGYETALGLPFARFQSAIREFLEANG
ncbi:MAG TPA: PIG-L family deacetylase [Bacillota bacterium]|nr:PIG-L family deacetylase [Bacillota bacterium]